VPIVPPVPMPLPTVAVVAPTQAQKQARSSQNVRPETMEAIDGLQKAEGLRAKGRRRDRRGQYVDILV